MFYGLRKQDIAPRPAAPTHPGCPLCGKTVVYAGFSGVECLGYFMFERGTKHCPNFRTVKDAVSCVGTKDWARIMKNRGLRLLVHATYGAGSAPCTYLDVNPHESWGEDDTTYRWEVMP